MIPSATTMSQLRASENYVWSTLDVLGEGATGAVYKARHKVWKSMKEEVDVLLLGHVGFPGTRGHLHLQADCNAK